MHVHHRFLTVYPYLRIVVNAIKLYAHLVLAEIVVERLAGSQRQTEGLSVPSFAAGEMSLVRIADIESCEWSYLYIVPFLK